MAINLPKIGDVVKFTDHTPSSFMEADATIINLRTAYHVDLQVKFNKNVFTKYNVPYINFANPGSYYWR